MESRGRSKEARQQGRSRDSSVSSAGREVRCACQYFQSDSLLPERVTLVGRPASRTSNMAATMGDHEYEPISPPPDKPPQLRVMDMDLEVSAELRGRHREPSESSTDSRERRFLRIPLDDDLVGMPGDGQDEDEAMGGRELGDTLNGHRTGRLDRQDEAMGGRELGDTINGHRTGGLDRQDERQRKTEQKEEHEDEHEDERYLAATPTTSASRTDCEFNTSQMDSSGLEDLPLKRDSRKKKMDVAEQRQSQARNFQQRLRSQAGRIRSKLRNMPRPSFNMPERPKFNMPERPKFNFPERPKFNLPERPKFNFPERPKFNFPERPKFNFPERPKFNLPQRPKITMPSLNLGRSTTSKPRTTSSTRRPLKERSVASTESAGSSSKKNIFDFKTYPRIFDRKSRRGDYATSSPKASRAQTPPPTMPSRKKGPVGSRWVHRFTDIKFADEESQRAASEEERERAARAEEERLEEEEFQRELESQEEKELEQVVYDKADYDSGHTESTTAFKDKDYAYAVAEEEDKGQVQSDQHISSTSQQGSDKEQQSSASSRRAGVLEEIDSDEFFLREKGLSQEDVDVGRYLTSEIRDAFRSPLSALSQMGRYENYYDENEDVENLGQQYRGTPEREPTRPVRTRSLRPRKHSPKIETQSPAEDDPSKYYNTFPPTRPKRHRRLPPEQQELEQEQQRDLEENQLEEEAEELRSIDVEQTYSQEMECDNGVHDAMEVEEKVVADQNLDAEEKEQSQQSVEETKEQWQENIHNESNPPLPPKRRKHSRRESVPESLCNGDYTEEDWLENVEQQVMPEEEMALRMESDYIIPVAPTHEDFIMPPIPPKRGHRPTSRGTSLADDDRTSRGASSLPSEKDHAGEEEESELPCDIEFRETGGYASVIKHPPQKPERPKRPKPPRPPAPTRVKRSVGQIRGPGHSYFFTLPRKSPPIRPLRNYSTLGPSRPPRRGRIAEYMEQTNQSEPYIEIGDDHFGREQVEFHDSNRDLQSGDVIEKMKGRPLPAPPRPPRKTRESKDAQEQQVTSEEVQSESCDALKSETQPIVDEAEVIAYEIQTAEAAIAALSDSRFYSQPGITLHEHEVSSRVHPDEEEAEEEEGQQGIPQEVPEEVCVSTQTDPLPDDYCVEGYEEEELQNAPIVTDVHAEMVEEPPVIDETALLLSSTVDQMPEKFSTKEDTQLSMPKIDASSIRTDGVTPEISTAGPVTNIQKSAHKQEIPPPTVIQTTIERQVPVYVMPDENTEVELLRTQRLQVVELDVERLNVGELQAQKIVVSDIDGMSLQVAELSSKSGNLVVNGIELPSGFLQELYDSSHPAHEAQTSDQPSQTPGQPSQTSSQHSQPSDHTPQPSSSPPKPSHQQLQSPSQPIQAAQTAPPAITPTSPTVTTSSTPTPQTSPTEPQPATQHISAPLQTPLTQQPIHQPIHIQPAMLGQSYITSGNGIHSFIPDYIPSNIPVSMRVPSRSRSHLSHMQRDVESEEEMISLVPRRRRHLSKPMSRYSSDEEEEEEYTGFHPPSRRHQNRPSEQSVRELSRQLLQACHGVTMRATSQLLQYVAPQVQDGDSKRRDLQTALCVLLILVAGLILLGFGSGKTFHHHHWDFHFPPRQ